MPLVTVLVSAVVVLGALPAYAGEAWVERAERRLNRLGCVAGKADGVVDERLRAGVIRFQAVSRTAQTGRLDAATRERLHGEGAKRCDDRAVPRRSGAGRRIVISQRQNWVWLVRADGTVKAQAGMVDNPQHLAPGTYRSGPQCGRPGRVRHNTDYGGRLWLHDFVRFANCGVGFHRIPVSKSSGRQIHPDWYLGTNFRESHGCIRLAAATARAVWRFTETRTRVVVVKG